MPITTYLALLVSLRRDINLVYCPRIFVICVYTKMEIINVLMVIVKAFIKLVYVQHVDLRLI